MDMRKAAGATGLAVVLFLAGAVGLTSRSGDASSANTGGSTTTTAEVGALVPSGASLAQTISNLQARVRAVPKDWRASANLGLAYVQQARITADPSYYPKAQGILRTSLATNTDENYAAMVGMASLAAARHDFSGALRWGERAKAIDPYNGNVYGVIGDAQIELGRYPDAFATFQKMVNTLPGLSSYSRVSYARELQGDIPGAIRSMKAAAKVASSPSDAAWASNQLGELYFNSGRLDRADAAYRRAAGLDPTFVPAVAGMGKVAWARGDLAGAIRRYTDATQRYPLPDYLIALGDLYTANGDEIAAPQQYDVLHAEEQIFAANGVNMDLEIALFQADHGDPAAGLKAAREEWGRRHSILVADAYAWALYRTGHLSEAARYSKEALSLGTQNALMEFHAGMIQLKLGNRGAAIALLQRAESTNPNFSITWSPVAAKTLARLGAAR
jgi:tetratricopeptide (TPR) repeat protein